MISYIKAWLITTAVFMVGDIPWLLFVMNRYFVHKIHHLMDVTHAGAVINFSSACTAYFLITFLLVWFIVVPLSKTPFSNIFLNGAIMGACVYGVYEFTNHATLTNWPVNFLMIDIAWGTLWCGAASVLSSWIIQYLKLD